MKKVLLTGANGFVGRHVVPELLKRGYGVVILIRDPIRAEKFNWFNAVEVVVHDIHSDDIFELSSIGNISVLIHLAWSGLPNYKAMFHVEKNLPADYRFLKSLIQQGLKQILVTGTCLEYGLQNGCLSVDMDSRPENPYALAKDTLRKFMHTLQKDYAFILQWARLFYMFGEGQNPVSLLAQLDAAIDRGDKIFNMSGGEQLRDYLAVTEVASMLVDLSEIPADGIFNICSGNPISIRRLVEEHLRKRNATIELNLGYYPYTDYEPMAFWGKSTRVSSR